MKREAVIEEILEPLEAGRSQAYIDTRLQVADIVEWALDQPLLKATHDPPPNRISLTMRWLRSIRLLSRFLRSFCGGCIISASATRGCALR